MRAPYQSIAALLRCAALIAPLALLPTIASASSFILISADRLVHEDGFSDCGGCGPGGTNPSTNSTQQSSSFGGFDEALSGIGSFASQSSTLAPGLLSGTGGVSVGFTASNTATTSLQVIFQVDTTGQYSLDGELTGIVDENRITLASTVATIFNRDSTFNVPFTENFMLQTGEVYTLEAYGTGFGFGNANGSTWQFAMVPEPGTGSLVGLGLAGLATQRRVRRQAKR